jgi:cation transport regulator ChaB
MNNLDRWAQYNYFIDNVSSSLSSIARDVWLVAFRHADVSGTARITRARIADKINVSKTHVSNGIKELFALKLIKKVDGDNAYILSLGVNYSLHPSQPQFTGESTTVDGGCQPQFTGESTTVYTPVNHSLHITEHSEPLTELYTEPITEHTQCGDVFELSDSPPIQKQPKQAKLPGTSKKDWKAKASSTFLFKALNMYPKHRRTYTPKEFQEIWDEAADEEGGHDVLWNMVREHLEKAVTSEGWTKEGGKYVPSMEKYIGKRKYRAPVVGAPEYGEEFEVGF